MIEPIERGITLKELIKSLTIFGTEHPELLERKIIVATECGYACASIGYPFNVAVSIDPQASHIRLLTDDDDFGRDDENYIFYSEKRGDNYNKEGDWITSSTDFRIRPVCSLCQRPSAARYIRCPHCDALMKKENF